MPQGSVQFLSLSCIRMCQPLLGAKKQGRDQKPQLRGLTAGQGVLALHHQGSCSYTEHLLGEPGYSDSQQGKKVSLSLSSVQVRWRKGQDQALHFPRGLYLSTGPHRYSMMETGQEPAGIDTLKTCLPWRLDHRFKRNYSPYRGRSGIMPRPYLLS